MTEEATALVAPKKTRKPKAPKADVTNEEVKSLVATSETEASEILATINGWQIESQEDMDDCGSIKLAEREKRERLEERLKEITAPMRAAEKSVRDLFRPAIQMHQKNEDICTEAIRQFELAKMQAARAARQAVEAAGGQADERTLLVAHGHGAVQAASEVSSKRVFRFEVKDPGLIPERYWKRVLDEKLIQSDINENTGKIEIPGVKVIEDVKVSLAARR